jgi:hypothetical protein
VVEEVLQAEAHQAVEAEVHQVRFLDHVNLII